VHPWKGCVVKATAGSNPVPSATKPASVWICGFADTNPVRSATTFVDKENYFL